MEGNPVVYNMNDPEGHWDALSKPSTETDATRSHLHV